MAQIILDRLVAAFTAGEIEQIGSQHGNEWARVRHYLCSRATLIGFIGRSSRRTSGWRFSFG